MTAADLTAVTDRFMEKVDDSGDCWMWKAATRRDGYGYFWLNGRGESAHRVSYELFIGSIPDGAVVDHMCHQPACVRPEHLRTATLKQNAENRTLHGNNTSGIRGVTWSKSAGKWMAQVRHASRRITVGFYDSLADADRAATDARNQLFTHNDTDRTAN